MARRTPSLVFYGKKDNCGATVQRREAGKGPLSMLRVWLYKKESLPLALE